MNDGVEFFGKEPTGEKVSDELKVEPSVESGIEQKQFSIEELRVDALPVKSGIEQKPEEVISTPKPIYDNQIDNLIDASVYCLSEVKRLRSSLFVYKEEKAGGLFSKKKPLETSSMVMADAIDIAIELIRETSEVLGGLTLDVSQKLGNRRL